MKKDTKKSQNSENPVPTDENNDNLGVPSLEDKSVGNDKRKKKDKLTYQKLSQGTGGQANFGETEDTGLLENEGEKQGLKNPSVDHPQKWEQKLVTISYIGLIAVLIVICLQTFFNTEDIPQKPGARPSFQQFKEDKIDKLRNEFPSQDSKQFWKVVNAPIRRMFVEEDPSYPAVLLFAIPKGPTASITGSCLAHQLTKHLNVFHGRNEAFIDIDKDLTHTNAAGDKRELDDKLINLYGVKESKGVAVDHFEKLSPLATLLFHGYCDGDHAPYKNVSMVLVLHTDMKHEDILRDKSAVDNFLQNLWAKELDGDKIPPLISRIANNVAIVTPEEEYSIKKLCPWL